MKRYIKSSNVYADIDSDYFDRVQKYLDELENEDPWAPTVLIDETVPESIYKLENLSPLDSSDLDITEYYRILKNAYDDYIADYKRFPNQNTLESLDIKYNDDKGRFYRKYLPLFNKCKELKDISISGYGQFDFIKTAINKIVKSVIYNYPVGWRMYR